MQRRALSPAAEPPHSCRPVRPPQAATVVAAVLCFFAGLEAFLNFCAGAVFAPLHACRL